MATKSKLQKFINWSMKVVLNDKRVMIGTFLSFDRHMNIVLSNTCEIRQIIDKKASTVGNTVYKDSKRPLGLIILRGEHVVSITVDAPPLPKPKVPIFKAEPGAVNVNPSSQGLQTLAGIGLLAQGGLPTGLPAGLPPVMPPGGIPGIPQGMPPGMPPGMGFLPPPPPPPL